MTVEFDDEYQRHMITVLVSQALDDLEFNNIDLETVLRLVATRAWTEGHREGAPLNPRAQGRS